MLFLGGIFLLMVLADVSCQNRIGGLEDVRMRLMNSHGEDVFGEELSNKDEESLTVRALRRAIGWTMNQRNLDYGWGSDTPHTVLALSLADDSWFNDKNLESQLVSKQFEIHLILRMWKHRESPMTSGQIALNIMAIVSLCRNPRSFYDKDLVALLERHENRMDFEIAFADLASCNAGRRLKRTKIRRLLSMVSHKPELHSVDTLSVVILALHCAQRQRRLELRTYMNEAIDILLSHQAKDGSFGSNLHSTAMALQALTMNGLSATWNVTQAQQYVMSHQLPDGSFGNIFDTNAVLPLLAGKTLLDVGRKSCQNQTPDIEIDPLETEVDIISEASMTTIAAPTDIKLPIPLEVQNVSSKGVEEMINMTYIIWIGDHVSYNYNLTFSVPKGTNFYQIMQLAAEKDQHYEFTASKWANGYYVHTLSGQHEKQAGFWFWLLYRLREPPVPGTKPDNKFVVGEGVIELIPNDGDILLFWYHKI